jgi:hypothetical protein
VVSQACGGGSASMAATPTARPLPSRVAANGTPGIRVIGTPDAGMFFQGFADSGLADFLGISQEQLRSELQARGATMASVAAAHGKTRDELKSFLTDQLRKNTQQAVTDGRMTQEQADSMLQDLSGKVDQMIDGNIRLGRPPGTGATSTP